MEACWGPRPRRRSLNRPAGIYVVVLGRLQSEPPAACCSALIIPLREQLIQNGLYRVGSETDLFHVNLATADAPITPTPEDAGAGV